MKSFFRKARGGNRLLPRLIWVAALNVLLLCLYFWAWRDEVLHVKVTVYGNQHIVSLGRGENEEILHTCEFQKSPAGRVGIFLAPSGGLWREWFWDQALDNVVIKEYPSGKVLFEDDFSSPESSQWDVRRGAFYINQKGQLTTVKRVPFKQEVGRIDVGDYGWKDYTVELDLINPHKFLLFVRVAPDGSEDRLTLWPQHWGFEWHKVPKAAGKLHVRIPRNLRLIARNVLENYGWAIRLSLFFTLTWFLCFAICWLIRLLARRRIFSTIKGLALFRSMARLPWIKIFSRICLVLFLVGVFATLCYITDVVHERVAHVQDSVSMLFQANIMASGRIYVPSPKPRFLDFFRHEFVTMNKNGDGRCFSKYLPGNSAVLAIGVLIGMPWIIPPIVGTAACLFIYLSARDIYSRGEGLLAIALAWCSPFFVMLAGSYMAHVTAMFFIAGTIFFFQRMLKRDEARWPLLAGLFLGACFATRPMSAVAVGVCLGPFALLQWFLWRREMSGVSHCWRKIAYSLLGLGIMLLLLGLYNYTISGDFLEPPTTYSFHHDTIGFGTRGMRYHDVSMAFRNINIELNQLLPDLFGWPVYLTLSFCLAPFFLSSRNRWDYLWLASIVMMVLGYATYASFPNNIFGARYWYEMLPFIFLLSARGIVMISRIPEGICKWFMRTRGRSDVFSRFYQYLHRASVLNMIVVVVFVLLLVQNNFQRTRNWPVLEYFNLKEFGSYLKDFPPGPLLSSWAKYFNNYYQRALQRHSGYNSCDARILKMVKERDIHNALIIVKRFWAWWTYGSVFPQNSPYFNGDIVYAQSRGPELDLELVRMYPGRSYYYADYYKRTLEKMDIPKDLFLRPPPADSIYATPVGPKRRKRKVYKSASSHVAKKPVLGPSLRATYGGIARGELICLEVEDFPEGGGWKRAANVEGYFGKGSFGSKEPGNPAAKTLKLNKGGAYSVWMRYAWRKEGKGRVRIDGWHADFGREKEGSGAWEWVRLGVCNLKKGKHTISIEDLGSGWTTIDSIILTLDEKFDPSKTS